MINKISILTVLICILLPIEAIACESLVGRQIIDLLINNQSNHAQKILSNQLVRNPSDPMNGFYQGTILWAKSEEGHNKKLAQQALITLKNSINTSQQKLKTTPNNSKLRLNSGMSQMLVARIHASRRQWIAAYRNGKRARLDLQRLTLKNPNEKDSLLGLGLFEFYTGSVPPSLRWLSKLMSFSGDKQKGIQLIQKAIKESPSFGPEAGRAIVNEIIYSGSIELCQYLGLAKDLRLRYPNNPQFSFGYQKIFNNCGYPQQALNDNNRARKQFAKYPKTVEGLNIQQLYIFSNLGSIKKIEEFKATTARDFYHRDVSLGLAYDVIGQRKKAVKAYQKAQKIPVDFEGANSHIKYLSTPYKKSSPQPISMNFPIAKGCG